MIKSEYESASIRINSDYCGKCSICSSVCPFDAILADEKTGEVKLDVQKCQVCGICFSACPTSAIETVYYNVDLLSSYVNKSIREKGLKTLVLTCRSHGPSHEGIMDILKKRNINEFISLRLPCVGRVTTEFFLAAFYSGINKLIVASCEDAYCRFKVGSKVSIRRVLLTQALLNQLGFETDALTMIRSQIKANIDTYRCVGCGNCAYICAYDAIIIEPPGIARINSDECSGCGACAAVCPAFAIKLRGFEYESISQSISNYSLVAREVKSKGITPVVLVFCCQWSEFSALDKIQSVSMKENVMLIELPCAGRVDSLHILEAFHLGFDGVLVVTCQKDECKLEKGNEKAEEHISLLKKLLNQIGLGDRLEICFSSPRYLGDFDTHLKSFIEKMSSLSK